MFSRKTRVPARGIVSPEAIAMQLLSLMIKSIAMFLAKESSPPPFFDVVKCAKGIMSSALVPHKFIIILQKEAEKDYYDNIG